MNQFNKIVKIVEYCDFLKQEADEGKYHNPYTEREKLIEMLIQSNVKYNSNQWVELEDLIYEITYEFWDM